MIYATSGGVGFEASDHEIKNTEAAEYVGRELTASGWFVEKASFDLSEEGRYERVVGELVSKGVAATLKKRTVRLTKDTEQVELLIEVPVGMARRARFLAARFATDWAERTLVVDEEGSRLGDTLKLVRRW